MKEGFKYKFYTHCNAPINANTKLEAEHVLKVGKKVFGEEHSNKGKLPFRAS